MRDWTELEKQLRLEVDKLGWTVKDGIYTTYRSIQYEGCLGDFAKEYWTDADYIKHNAYITDLGEDYGKPFISTISIMHDKWKDEQIIKTGNMESYSFDIIDFSK